MLVEFYGFSYFMMRIRLIIRVKSVTKGKKVKQPQTPKLKTKCTKYFAVITLTSSGAKKNSLSPNQSTAPLGW